MIAPLDWGLGHATRCVPVIKQLMQDNVVLLGSTPLTKPLFDQEFPSLQQVALPSYNVSYSASIPLWLKLFFDSGRIRNVIRKEHETLDKLIAEHHIDTVISDNRFGLYHSKAHTVFITHQLFLKAPVFQFFARYINGFYIKRFNEVWVPDLENAQINLSGELSHGHSHFHDRITYIGPQSRLQHPGTTGAENKHDYLLLLSGPEPQRTILEDMLLRKFSDCGRRVAMVRGTIVSSARTPGEVQVIDFPDAGTLQQLILSSETVICRSGYSTLMDLYVLKKKKLVLIPTPGQSEQEYLAQHWHRTFGAKICRQDKVQELAL